MNLEGIFSITQRPEKQKVYTTEEIAYLLDTSCEKIRQITNYYRVERTVVSTKKSRASVYTYDAMRQIEAYFKMRQQKAEQKKVKQQEPKVCEDESAELHPLVKDKRCLKLNWWPDIVPSYF